MQSLGMVKLVVSFSVGRSVQFGQVRSGSLLVKIMVSQWNTSPRTRYLNRYKFAIKFDSEGDF